MYDNNNNNNEDTDMVVTRLIEEGTRTPNVQVVRTKRLVSRNHFPGLVKIELASITDKVTVLRNKRNLAENHEFRCVFLRSSKPHSDRIAEFNFRKLLQQLPNGKEYRLGGNGRIINNVQQLATYSSHPMMYNEPLGTQGLSPNVTRLATPISMFSDDLHEEISNDTQRQVTPTSGDMV